MGFKKIEISPAVPAGTEVVVVKAAKPAVTKEVEVGPGYLPIYQWRGEGKWNKDTIRAYLYVPTVSVTEALAALNALKAA